MKWVAGIAAVVGAVALALAGVVAWVVPGIATRAASTRFEQATGRKLAIGALSIHPFTWRVEVRDLSMSEPGGKGTFASFRRAEASVAVASLWKGAPIIRGVRLEGPHFDVVRTAPNTYNFSDLLKYLEAPIPEIVLEDVAITDGTIDFHDRAQPREELHTVRDAQLIVPFLTTLPSQASRYGNPRFHAVVDGAPLSVEATVRGLPKAVEASAELDLEDLSLPLYLAYVPAEIPVNVESGKLAVKGTASFRITEANGAEAGWDGQVRVTEVKVAERGGPARLSVGDVTLRTSITSGQKRGMLLHDGSLEVTKVAVPFGGRDGISVGLLALRGLRFSDRKSELDVDAVLVQDGRATVTRDRKGRLSVETFADALARRLPRTKASHPAPATPIRFRISRLEGNGLGVRLTDRSRRGSPTFDLTGVAFLVQDLTGPKMEKTPFELSAHLGKEATLAAKGWVVPEPLALDAEVRVKGLDLSAAGPYVNEETRIVLASGRLDATMAASVAMKGKKLGGTFRGDAAIRDLEILDGNRRKLVAWNVLAVEGVDGQLAPEKVRVARIGLDGLRVSLVVDERGNSNLPKGKEAGAPPAAKRSAGTTPAKAGAAPSPAVRIDVFHLTRGLIDFTDRSVPGPFRAQVRDVDVELRGMSTEPGTAADLRARLVLPKGAPLTITGKAAPLKSPVYADMDLVLDKLDLTSATPYAGTYLGLEVDRGTLTVKSRAKVANGDIAAENRIWVEQLDYGKAVKSEKATILPVRLLTDILRNRDGDIVLVLPVKARTDDENLVGKIVVQVAGEVVFPPGSPLKSIPFEACSAELSGDARERLRRLASALDERKAMRIDAMGFVDRDVDDQACARRIAALRAVQEKAAQAGTTPAKPAGPTTAAAILVPPAYLSLEGEPRLAGLARARAEGVRAYLVGEGKVAPERVAAQVADIHSAPTVKADARPRVEFKRMGD